MAHAHAVAGAYVAPRTATGIPNGKLGMWIFLASEVMFFTGLIGAYLVLRMGHPSWVGPEGHLSVGIGTLNTLILICSSTTIVLALAADARQQIAAVRGYLAATIGLGALFVLIKIFIEYAAKISHHILPSSSVFWASYYTLTGFHLLHVLGGIVFNLVVLSSTATPAVWAHQRRRLEWAGLYWHFVDIVWIFLFPLLYLFSR
ncbi:MAG: cytochrome c oxidase subunit 3 [Candidatus Omnitrophica bacterium]|nr:cytochrome c oxidase subunit 3 [Candidatus Omnitrophota bacterium]